jgi:hypothetical protein
LSVFHGFHFQVDEVLFVFRCNLAKDIVVPVYWQLGNRLTKPGAVDATGDHTCLETGAEVVNILTSFRIRENPLGFLEGLARSLWEHEEHMNKHSRAEDAEEDICVSLDVAKCWGHNVS